MKSKSCIKSHTERKYSATPIQFPASSDTSVFSSAMTLYLQQPPSKIWRRERDSNPRWVAPHLISSQAQSATLSSLRTDSFIGCDYRIFGKLNQQDFKQKNNVRCTIIKTPPAHRKTSKEYRPKSDDGALRPTYPYCMRGTD